NPAHRVEVIDGDFIDLRTDLDAGAMGKPTSKDAKSNVNEQRGEDRAAPGREPSKKKAAERAADALAQAISEGVPEGERSEVVWFVVNEMLRRGYRTEAIERVLLDRNNEVSAHIYDQSKPHEYAARQVEQAIEKIEFICTDKGKIIPTVPA